MEEKKLPIYEFLDSLPNAQPEDIDVDLPESEESAEPIEVYRDTAGEVGRLAKIFMRQLQDSEHPYILLSTAAEVIAHAIDSPAYREEAQAYINGLYLLEGRTFEQLAAEGFTAPEESVEEIKKGVMAYYNRVYDRLARIRKEMNDTENELLQASINIKASITELSMEAVRSDPPAEETTA